MTRTSLARTLAAAAFAILGTLHAAEPPAAPSPLERARTLATSGDFAGALALLEAEAGKGNAEAANALGEANLAGYGPKASAAEAARWFQQATDASFAPGMLNLAMLLRKGAEGVPADPDKAVFLIRAAAEEGYAPAQVASGRLAEEGGEDKGDMAAARAWYEKAAAQENADGLLALARFLDNGIAGERDAAKAFDACRRAAIAGSALAMNEVGVRYQKGQGIEPDQIAAIGWFTVAAQRGLPASHVNLGNCYEVGKGVLRDLDMAGSHYAAAAKQNFGPAQYLLAQLFEQGKGAKANPVYAYVNYTRAASNGIEAAAKKAAETKEKLTPDQLAEAAKLLTEATPGAAAPAPAKQEPPAKKPKK